MSGWVTRRRLVAIASVLAWALVLSPAAAQTSGDEPPDQIDPPAEGEGEPLDDPSDPPPSAYSTAGYPPLPSPRISLSGMSWGNPTVHRHRATSRFTGAQRASKSGWDRRARSVVLTSGVSFASSIAASSLAGAVDGPLLLSSPRRLPDSTAREIQRLRPRRVFVVGQFARRVTSRVQNLGPNVIAIAKDDPYSRAMAVAREAVRRGANARTVVVASGRSWKDSLGVPALAAGKQHPVLLAKRSSGAEVLARRVRELGARRVLVVGRRQVINARVVRALPNMRRIAGSTSVATVAATARRARSLGQTGRVTVVGAGTWADAAAWGVMTGGRRDGVVLASRGPGLSPAVAQWLRDVRPGHISEVNAATGISATARCQLGSGRFRSWYCAEKTLKRQGYHIPAADGRADRFSVWAIYAFEKVARRSANGSFGNAEWAKMLQNPRHAVKRKDLPGTHVEIDIERQLVLLVENGKVRYQFHTSTGKPSTPTIRGTFTVYDMRPYFQSYNKMYWPVFFQGGYAIHGYPSIPTYPASAGCARVYNGNMDFIYRKMFYGERVATY